MNKVFVVAGGLCSYYKTYNYLDDSQYIQYYIVNLGNDYTVHLFGNNTTGTAHYAGNYKPDSYSIQVSDN